MAASAKSLPRRASVEVLHWTSDRRLPQAILSAMDPQVCPPPPLQRGDPYREGLGYERWQELEFLPSAAARKWHDALTIPSQLGMGSLLIGLALFIVCLAVIHWTWTELGGTLVLAFLVLLLGYAGVELWGRGWRRTQEVRALRAGWRIGTFLADGGLIVRRPSRRVLAIPSERIIGFRSEIFASKTNRVENALVEFYDAQGNDIADYLIIPQDFNATTFVQKLDHWLARTRSITKPGER